MASDQVLNYRVRIDDSDFQSRLSQMRASIDMTMGGIGGGGGFGVGIGGGYGMGMGLSNMYNVMGGMGGGAMFSGLSDFGTQIRPVSYTPPAIAMTPHFGMIAVNQTMTQAGLGMLGPVAMGLQNPFSPRSPVPNQISLAEYSQLSARNFGMRAGDAVATGGMVTASTVANLGAASLGSWLGASALSGLPYGALIGGVIGGAAAAAVPAAYFGAVTDMMADNRSIQTALGAGSFRFITGGQDVDPVTGRGFSRAARANVASAIQSMQLTDPRFGAGEYRQILEAGMQMDIFSGTRDAEDFKGKFKGLVDSIKTVTATLHTSLKEGMEVIRGFRDMGVTDQTEVARLTMGAEAMGRASGRTGMEMLAVGQAGAEMFRGTGIRMGLGFELNQQNTTLVRGMLNQGLITREMVGQAGGENALGQQLTANALAGTQTALARGAMMANFNPATGQFNPNMVANMMGQSAWGMVAGAGRMAGSPLNIMRLQAHQEELLGQMSPTEFQMMGMAPALAEARTIAGFVGAKTQQDFFDVFTSQQLRRNVSPAVIKSQIAMLQMDPEKFRESQQASFDATAAQMAAENFRNRFGFKRITNVLERELVKPVSDVAMGVAGTIEQAAIDLGQAALGINTPRAVSAATLKRGNELLKQGVHPEQLVIDQSGTPWERMMQGQTAANLLKDVTEADKTGKAVSFQFQGQEVRSFASRKEVEDYARQHGQMAILGMRDEGGGKPHFIAMSTAGQQQIRDHASKFDVTSAVKEKTEADIAKNDPEAVGTRKILAAAIRSETAGGTLTADQAAAALFGDKVTLETLGADKDKSKIAKLEHYLAEAGSRGKGALKQIQDTRKAARDVADAQARGSFDLEAEARKEGYQSDKILGGGGIQGATYAAAEHFLNLGKLLPGGQLITGAAKGLLSMGIQALGGESREAALAARALTGTENADEKLKAKEALFAQGLATKKEEQVALQAAFEQHAMKAGLTEDQRKQLMANITNMSQEERRRGLAATQKEAVDLAAANKARTGGAESAVSTAGGQLTPDQIKALADMANAMKTAYADMIIMHNNFAAKFPVR